MFKITGSAFKSAATANRAVLYTASECVGCFDRSAMAAQLRALAPGESVSFVALRFVGGPSNPPPIVLTRV